MEPNVIRGDDGKLYVPAEFFDSDGNAVWGLRELSASEAEELGVPAAGEGVLVVVRVPGHVPEGAEAEVTVRGRMEEGRLMVTDLNLLGEGAAGFSRDELTGTDPDARPRPEGESPSATRLDESRLG